MKTSTRTFGFTIIELMISLSIVAILATTVALSWDEFKGRADKAKCVGQMRSIFISLEFYMKDHDDIWPQIQVTDDEEAYWEQWYKTLEPYGIYQEVWLCPTHRGLMRSEPNYKEEDEPEFDSSFGPATFDDRPFTAYRWTQPWLIEENDHHGFGNHVLMPDGSIDHFSMTGK